MSEPLDTEEWVAGPTTSGTYRCVECGAFSTVTSDLPVCPTCGGDRWTRCLSIPRLAAGMRDGWKGAELRHLQACESCRRRVAIAWHLGDLDIRNLWDDDDSVAVFAKAAGEHIHTDNCRSCRVRLTRLAAIREDIDAPSPTASAHGIDTLFVGTSPLKAFLRRTSSVTMLILLDLAVLAATSVVSIAVVDSADEGSLSVRLPSASWIVYGGATLFLVFLALGLYRQREHRGNRARAAAAALLTASLALVMLLALGEAGAPLASFVLGSIVWVTVAALARGAYEARSARVLHARGVRRRVILIGREKPVRQVVRSLGKVRDGIEYVIHGYVATEPDALEEIGVSRVPRLGWIEDLSSVLARLEPLEVIVVDGDRDLDRRVKETILAHNASATVEAALLAPFPSFDFRPNQIVKLEQIAPTVLPPAQTRAKQGFDYVVATIGLAAFAFGWVWMRIATGRQPIKHDIRLGYMRRPFFMLSFDCSTADLDRRTRLGRARIACTRFGARFERIPQVWNVLRGEMSIVGPEPLKPSEDRHDTCQLVPPGITGLCQISGITERQALLNLDLRYLATWTLWGDVEILAKSLWEMVRRNPTARRAARWHELELELEADLDEELI